MPHAHGSPSCRGMDRLPRPFRERRAYERLERAAVLSRPPPKSRSSAPTLHWRQRCYADLWATNVLRSPSAARRSRRRFAPLSVNERPHGDLTSWSLVWRFKRESPGRRAGVPPSGCSSRLPPHWVAPFCPALIFLAVAGGGTAARGWGVPMATDIAFALGVLALLGGRAPIGLRIFLTALAIVDDLLAVLVIALFYTADLSFPALAAAGGLFGALVHGRIESAFVVRWCTPCSVPLCGSRCSSPVSTQLSRACYSPSRSRRGRDSTPTPTSRTRGSTSTTSRAGLPAVRMRAPRSTDAALWELEEATERAQAPMLRIEHALHPWVAFLIVPVHLPLRQQPGAAPTTAGDRDARTIQEPIAIGVIVWSYPRQTGRLTLGDSGPYSASGWRRCPPA